MPMFWFRCVVLLPAYVTSTVLAEDNCRCTEKFHSCTYVTCMSSCPVSTSGVSQESATNPNEHGCPGRGFGDTFGWPRKKSAQVRVGAAGTRLLKIVVAATNGTVATVLLIVLLSGYE